MIAGALWETRMSPLSHAIDKTRALWMRWVLNNGLSSRERTSGLYGGMRHILTALSIPHVAINGEDG